MAVISGKWSPVADTLRLRRSSQAVSVIGNTAYVFGGELRSREPIDDKIDIIDLEGREEPRILPTTAKAPIARVGSPSTTVNGNIWLFSGRGGVDMKPIEENGGLWRYDVGGATWDLIKPTNTAAKYPEGRSYHCVASDDKTKIYLHAGCPVAGRLSDLWVFNIENKTWTALASAPEPARGGASIAYVNEKLYRLNGFDGKTEQGGAIDAFDVSSGSWSTITYHPDGVQGPEARSVATFLPVTVGSKTYIVTVFGERDPSSLGHAGAGKMLSDVWAWDLEQTKWHQVAIAGDTPVPRGWFDADVAADGPKGDAIIVHGGLNEENERLGDIWRLSFNCV